VREKKRRKRLNSLQEGLQLCETGSFNSFAYLQRQQTVVVRDVCRSVALRFVAWNVARRSESDNFGGASATVRLPLSKRSS
jgi:hypothetical protein